MNKKEIIEKLENFKSLLNKWDHSGYSEKKLTSLRSDINKKRPFTQKVLRRTGTAPLLTITPPPLVGGFVMNNVNPFDIIFDPPFGMSANNVIIDSIDQAVGIIENDDNFELERKALPVKKDVVKGSKSKKIFLVHGHDNELKETVARFLEKIELEPIILHEQVNEGLTLIEKFEKHSDVNFAIVLMTPDDVGNSKNEQGKLNSRARQNVILELGYFLAKLGRKNVCALIKGNIERPSDYDGVIYVGVDPAQGWKLILAKELKEAKIEFDSNKNF